MDIKQLINNINECSCFEDAVPLMADLDYHTLSSFRHYTGFIVFERVFMADNTWATEVFIRVL